MATARFATVVAIEKLASDVRAFTLETPAEEPLGFTGGQYIIVDSGQVAASGKAIKRAYSIVSADAHQQRFVLASKRLPGGPGSGYMHERAIGDTLKFSGPWGKMVAPPAPVGRSLVIATDTGITAALGLVQADRFAPFVAATRLTWFRTDAGYFVPDSFVRERLPAGLDVQIETLPPIHHPERVAQAKAALAADLAPGRIAHFFSSGDGTINYALLDHFVAQGVTASRDSVESFFNYPKKVDAAPVMISAAKVTTAVG